MTQVELLEDLEFNPGEGRLYRSSDGRLWLVYTGESHTLWDVAPTEPEGGVLGKAKWLFRPCFIQSAASEKAAVAALKDALNNGDGA